MKKSILFILLVSFIGLSLSGCMASKSKITTTYPNGVVVEEELTDDASFNKLQTDVIASHSALIKEPPVIASFTVPGGTTVNIHSQNTPAYPIIKQRSNAYVESLKTIVNSTPLAIVAGGWTAKQVLQNSQGDVYASDNAQVTTTSNSNNPTDIRKADGDISEDHSDNSMNDSNNTPDYSDNSIKDSYNQTADPTIVEQPEYNDPVIVRPEIVDPVVIQPEVTE